MPINRMPTNGMQQVGGGQSTTSTSFQNAT